MRPVIVPAGARATKQSVKPILTAGMQTHSPRHESAFQERAVGVDAYVLGRVPALCSEPEERPAGMGCFFYGSALAT